MQNEPLSHLPTPHQGTREGIMICYRLFSTFLFIDLSTVTKFIQYSTGSIYLSGYCVTIFISYSCYLITIELRNFGILEIYDELTLNGQCPILFTQISRFDLAGFQHALHPYGNRYQLGPSFPSRRYQIYLTLALIEGAII